MKKKPSMLQSQVTQSDSKKSPPKKPAYFHTWIFFQSRARGTLEDSGTGLPTTSRHFHHHHHHHTGGFHAPPAATAAEGAGVVCPAGLVNKPFLAVYSKDGLIERLRAPFTYLGKQGGTRGAFQFLEQQKQVCFQQTHNQGLLQLFLRLSWDLHAHLARRT